MGGKENNRLVCLLRCVRVCVGLRPAGLTTCSLDLTGAGGRGGGGGACSLLACLLPQHGIHSVDILPRFGAPIQGKKPRSAASVFRALNERLRLLRAGRPSSLVRG